MSYLDRIVDDGTNRESWLKAHDSRITASDAQSLAKPTSIASYLARKLKPSSFSGNEHTRSGNRWEPMMLAWAGIPQNLALIASPTEPDFASTPDGVALEHGVVRLAECKAKHDKIVDGPSLGEWRQLAWQFETIPEAETLEFVWAEIVGGELRSEEPKHLTVHRGDKRILKIGDQIRPLATELLAMLRIALALDAEDAA